MESGTINLAKYVRKEMKMPTISKHEYFLVIFFGWYYDTKNFKLVF